MRLTFESAVRGLCPIYGYRGNPWEEDFEIWFDSAATQSEMDAAIALADGWTAQPEIDWTAIAQNLSPMIPIAIRYGDRLVQIR